MHTINDENNIDITSSPASKTVADLAEKQVVSCTPDTDIKSAARLMSERHCSSVVIVSDQVPVGIWTEADALKVDYSDPSCFEQPIQALMSTDLLCVSINTPLDDATLKLKQHNIRHLIVLTREKTLYGIISQSDIVSNQEAESFVNMTEVGSIMSGRMPPTLDLNCTLDEAVNLMRNEHSDALIVTRDNTPKGLITERDLIRLISLGQGNIVLHRVMSSPLLTIPENMSLLACRSLMEKRHIRHIGVCNHQSALIGLVSFSDILTSIELSYIQNLKRLLKEQSADLKETEHHLHLAHTLIEAYMDGVMVTNSQGIIQSINPAFTILTGYAEKEALGQPASLISSGKHDQKFYDKMWSEIKAHGRWQGEIWNRRKNGEVYPEWLTITRIRDPKTREIMFAGIFSDITERKKSEQVIKNLAYYDALTGLPNRQLLFDRFDVALASSHRDGSKLALLFIDVDHFKRINDSLGHSVGDQVLCEITYRLNKEIREGDTLARLGGDEFVLLLTEIHDTDVIYRVAQRISECFTDPIEVGERSLYVTSSIGCSVYPVDGIDRETLLRNSDTAMYKAKKSGRNAFSMYSAEMNALSHLRLETENRLREALSNQELFLQYQPKYTAQEETIAGFEALLRWQDREQGLIPPDHFIPIAEELGLINDIGNWVLKEAAQKCQHWNQLSGKRLPVSVNVSVKQLEGNFLIHGVREALHSSGLEPNLLEIEVTETSFMTEMDQAITNINALKNMGVSISMDDFGTGYSNLGKLTQMPLDILKIDRSFLAQVPGDSKSEVLISTIILMAHSMGLKVVAEGVETKDQLRFIKQQKCDQIQGFYLSKPVNQEEVEHLIKKS